MGGKSVSIPFKRESVWQVFRLVGCPLLQNHVSIPFKRESVLQDLLIFFCKTKNEFQFPSNGKVYCKNGSPVALGPNGTGFNSLQTGKCIASFGEVVSAADGEEEVSIPFKRESVLQEPTNQPTTVGALKFQFPSNGKVYCKTELQNHFGSPALFPFPSNGKVYCKFPLSDQERWQIESGFHSLQTGKCIARIQ